MSLLSPAPLPLSKHPSRGGDWGGGVGDGGGALTLWQAHTHLEQGQQVLHVTLDALGNTWVLSGGRGVRSHPGLGDSTVPAPALPNPNAHLDLHGHLSPILKHALVHLPDGGSGKGHFLQGGHLVSPVLA